MMRHGAHVKLTEVPIPGRGMAFSSVSIYSEDIGVLLFTCTFLLDIL